MSMFDQERRGSSAAEWDRLEKIVERFEQAWLNGQHPAIKEYIKASTIEPGKLLVELVHADLECRLKAGQPARVEDYLQQFAELANDRERLLGLIAAEYKFRLRFEPQPSLDEYIQRFPQVRADLAEQLKGPHPREGVPVTGCRCPHCHKPIPFAENGANKQITCSSCGNTFCVDIGQLSFESLDQCGQLDRFQLLQAVGQGAFGTVYRAKDSALGRTVAIKVPRGGGESFAQSDQDRFAREARNVAQLSHPGIVPVYEVGGGGRVPYIVSAFVEGSTLAEVLGQRRLGFRDAAEIVAQVADALEHAHQHGVVHRDLKPSNIMLGQIEGTKTSAVPANEPGEGRDAVGSLASSPCGLRAFVMDFGLARRDEGEVTVTLEGQVLGTPAYMSPEQARGEGHEVGGQSDIYSLGVILYEMLTGELPFRGVARMMLQQILSEEPRPPRWLNDQIPRDLETIALKCLAKEPSRRYATAGAFARDLRRYLEGEPIHARPVGRVEKWWRWAVRNPRVASLSAAVVLLLTTLAIGSVVAAFQIGQKRDAALQAREDAAKAQARAEENALFANQQRDAAIRAHKEAAIAQSHAEENALFASQQRDLTLETLNKLVYEVQDQLRHKPSLHKLREALLKTALAGLDRVDHSARGANADRSVASAHKQLGDIFMVLGQTPRAQEHYGRYHAIAKELARKTPESPEAKHFLAVSHEMMGDLAFRQRNMALARENFQTCLTQCEQLLTADSQNASALWLVTEACLKLGDVDIQTGQIARARDYFRKALDHCLEWNTLDPQGAEAQRHLSMTYEKLGDVYFQSKDFESAREYYRRLRAPREALLAADPTSQRAQHDLSVAYQKMGDATYWLEEPTVALDYFRTTLELREALLKADPHNSQCLRDLANTCSRMALACFHTGDAAKAREYQHRSAQLREQLASADPLDTDAQIALAIAYYESGRGEIQAADYDQAVHYLERSVQLLNELKSKGKVSNPQLAATLSLQEHMLGIFKTVVQTLDDLDRTLAQPSAQLPELLPHRARALIGRGRFSEAVLTVQKLRELAPENPETLYNVACCYAFCVARMAQGRTALQLKPEEIATKDNYAEQAIEALTEAVNRGYRDFQHLGSDPDLLTIRADPRYRRLIERAKDAQSSSEAQTRTSPSK